MIPPLLIAAGGGGDAIASVAIARRLDPDNEPVVMSLAWERLAIDPRPGPRCATDFRGLIDLGRGLCEVDEKSGAKAPSVSLLPRLAGETGARVLLLDPTGGVTALAGQILRALEVTNRTEVLIVDVGGDVLAHGDEPELLSPLADSAVLAACATARCPGSVAVLGAGLDGELTGPTIAERLQECGAAIAPEFSSLDFTSLAAVFGWHPSEASGLLAAASCGIRGTVEVRDRGRVVVLGDEATTGYRVAIHRAAHVNTIAASLLGTRSLSEIEEVITARRGGSELDYERRKAASISRRPAWTVDLGALDSYAADATARGIDYLTVRRAAEILHAPFGAVASGLARYRSARFVPPLYRLRAVDGA